MCWFIRTVVQIYIIDSWCVGSVKKQSIYHSMKQKNQFSFHLHRYNVWAGRVDWLNKDRPQTKTNKQTNKPTILTATSYFLCTDVNALYFITTVSGFSCRWHARCNTIFSIQFTTLQLYTICCTAVTINHTAHTDSSEQ